MAKVLIVGIGNPLRGDDGLAWHATQLLERELRGQDVEIFTCHQLTPDLAEAASRSGLLVLIDACAEGEPGSLTVQQADLPLPSSSTFTHDFSLSTLLNTSQSLYGRSPRATIFTIAAECFPYGSELSPRVSAAIPALVDQVRKLVSGYQKDSKSQRKAFREDSFVKPKTTNFTTIE